MEVRREGLKVPGEYREGEGAMKGADVICAMQPIREQQGGEEAELSRVCFM